MLKRLQKPSNPGIPVFRKFYVIDGGHTWDYKYAASPEVEVPGSKKAEEELTVIHYHGVGLAIADPLTKKRNPGSSPAYIPGWKHGQLLNMENNIWRRGHMVSEAFGGKGRLENSSIITQSINSQMSGGPEELAKNETSAGKILKYKVSWKNHPAKGEIENFAREIIVEIFEKKEGKEMFLKKYAYQDLSEPPTAENVVLNLNIPGEDMLSKHFNLDLLFARELIIEKENGPYSDLQDVRDRMEFYYLKLGYAYNR